MGREVGDARIVVVGSTMIDLVAYADRLPGDGETVVGSSYVTGFGGKGANQAVMAARFGAEVAMVNTLGEDDARHGVSRAARRRGHRYDLHPARAGVIGRRADLGGPHGHEPHHHRPWRQPGGPPGRRSRGRRDGPAAGRDRPVRDPAGDDRGRVRRRAHARCDDRPEPGTGRPGRPGAARRHRLAGPERARSSS